MLSALTSNEMNMSNGASTNEDESPETYLPTILAHLDPTDDVRVLGSIRANIRSAEELRARQCQDGLELLKKLGRDCDAAKRSAHRPNRAIEAEEHQRRMAALDNDKYSKAKGIRGLEEELERLEARRRELASELAKVAEQEKKYDEMPPPDDAVKLTIYKNLGIHLITDDNDKVVECRVHSQFKNDVETLQVNDKFSRFFYANSLWEMCS
ncbi:kinetochore-associated Ndc80 complex subunit spc24 [Irineochytrium annulatum]|nr:kinetochore-associated Ndc80 complex subunit spc24 [Irineochytrium annulatum]